MITMISFTLQIMLLTYVDSELLGGIVHRCACSALINIVEYTYLITGIMVIAIAIASVNTKSMKISMYLGL